jgi:two-component system cell cycle sensor histidine kinase/response regulator CckA
MTGEDPKHEFLTPAPAADFWLRLVAASPVAMAGADWHNRVVAWNRSCERLLGLPAAKMMGQSILCAVPENRRRALGRLLERSRAGRSIHFEIHFNTPDGQARNLMVMLCPMPDPAWANSPGPPSAIPAGPHEAARTGVAAWLVDQTLSRRTAQRLAQEQKMASLGTLAGGIAHHFNNILGGVATYVDFALTSGDPTAMKRALQITSQAAARAGRITSSLLSFATADHQRTDLSDLTEVILTVAHLMEKPLADAGIVLKLDIEPGPVFPIQTAQINRVLRNLLDNARESMPGGGKITIGVIFDKAVAVLTVADTGCGIAKEDMARVFDPFFTTKSSSAPGEADHAGLGLCAVHGIVENIGGCIEVASQPGKGAKFSIFLPATG